MIKITDENRRFKLGLVTIDDDGKYGYSNYTLKTMEDVDKYIANSKKKFGSVTANIEEVAHYMFHITIGIVAHSNGEFIYKRCVDLNIKPSDEVKCAKTFAYLIALSDIVNDLRSKVSGSVIPRLSHISKAEIEEMDTKNNKHLGTKFSRAKTLTPEDTHLDVIEMANDLIDLDIDIVDYNSMAKIVGMGFFVQNDISVLGLNNDVIRELDYNNFIYACDIYGIEFGMYALDNLSYNRYRGREVKINRDHKDIREAIHRQMHDLGIEHREDQIYDGAPLSDAILVVGKDVTDVMINTITETRNLNVLQTIRVDGNINDALKEVYLAESNFEGISRNSRDIIKIVPNGMDLATITLFKNMYGSSNVIFTNLDDGVAVLENRISYLGSQFRWSEMSKDIRSLNREEKSKAHLKNHETLFRKSRDLLTTKMGIDLSDYTDDPKTLDTVVMKFLQVRTF